MCCVTVQLLGIVFMKLCECFFAYNYTFNVNNVGVLSGCGCAYFHGYDITIFTNSAISCNFCLAIRNNFEGTPP